MQDMPPPSSGAWETAILWLSLIVTWLAGEAGRAALAGAAGGLVRWFMTEGRRIRDGVIAVPTGALFAAYLTPVVLAIMDKWVGPIGDGGGDSAAFATGLGGMSIAKIILAIFDAQAARLSQRGGGDE